MITSDRAKSLLISTIESALKEEAKKVVSQVRLDYEQVDKTLGNASVSSDILFDTAYNTLTAFFFAQGQRALIAEYGKGSLMDRENPALSEYLKSNLFNADRIANNLATMSRVLRDGESRFYYDLDGKAHRKRMKTLINRELPNSRTNKINKRFQPVKPQHIIRQAIKERLNIIVANVASAVALNIAMAEMIDGLQIRVKL